jgi:tetratricopeptide (TPR) repeat protein
MSFMKWFALLAAIFLTVTAPARADQSDPRLERLFNQLAAVRTPPEAAVLVAQIDAIWSQSGSDTVDLLLSRAAQSEAEQDFETAMKILDTLVEMRANYAEAWYRRATLLLQLDSQQEAAADLAKTVRLEPRHFRAHGLIGRIADLSGKSDAALLAYKRALMLNPMFEPVMKRAIELNIESKRRPPI